MKYFDTHNIKHIQIISAKYIYVIIIKRIKIINI